VESLAVELQRARALEVQKLADAIETIGFECTRCGACCRAETCSSGEDGDAGPTGEPHTATVFPDEIRRLQGETDADWRDVARPMPYGLETASGEDTGEVHDGDGAQDAPTGSTFEWALQTDGCGDCTFYEESDGTGACSVHEDRPLICRTYPFSVALGGTTQPMGEAVDAEGMVRAHECEGLGRDIDRDDAVELARALKRRALRELQEAIDVRDNYESVTPAAGEIVVHDSEGPKHVDGTPFDPE